LVYVNQLVTQNREPEFDPEFDPEFEFKVKFLTKKIYCPRQMGYICPKGLRQWITI